MNNPNPAPISDLSPVDPRVQPDGPLSGEVNRGGNSRLDTSGVVEGAPYVEMPDGQKFLAVGWAMLSPFAQGYVEALLDAGTDTFGLVIINAHHKETNPVFSDIAPEALAMVLRDCERFVAHAKMDLSGLSEAGASFWRLRQADTAAWAYAFPPLRAYLNDAGKVALTSQASEGK